MHILVINSGSSSIKASMFESKGGHGDLSCVFDSELSGIGTPEARLELAGADGKSLPAKVDGKAATPAEAVSAIFRAVQALPLPPAEAVGYRVVHPGAKIEDHQRITEDVLHEIGEAAAFAPLHDPAVIEVIRAGMKQFPDVPHYACFDTVFHRTMPAEATTYPIPRQYREQGVRRYGFHGLSCESIVRQMRAKFAELPGRMVIAHLGSGCSVTALLDGHSVDTSMGLTPTGGVVMGTRPGDLDPGLVLYLLRQEKGDATAAVEAMLNHDAGMVALSGLPNDMKEVRKAAEGGNADSELALKVFTRSVRKTIGGYCWLMGGLDAVVFAGGIGEHDAATRAEVLRGLQEMGVVLDMGLNEAKGSGLRLISAPASAVHTYVAPAQEDWMIAVHVDRMAQTGK